MKKALAVTALLLSVIIQPYAAMAAGKAPYSIDGYYNSIILLWDDGNITEAQALSLANAPGINFDIDAIAPFKQKLLAQPGADEAKINKGITELVTITLAAAKPSPPKAEAATPTSPATPASPVAVSKANAAALKSAAALADQAASDLKTQSDKEAAAKSAAAAAAANPGNQAAADLKDSTANEAEAAKQVAAVSSAASDAAKAKATGSSTPANPNTQASPGTNNSASSFPFFVTGGAEFQNPYAIVRSGSSLNLTNAGNNTVSFVEFDWINRYVMRQKDYASDTNLESEWWGANTNSFVGGYLQNPLKHYPDFQADIGFVFDNGVSSTNQSYSATTLAGGGDFYSDFQFGVPLWRANQPEFFHKVQISLESSDGIVTEKSFQEIHPNAFIGLGLQSSISAGAITNCLLSARVGAGWLDKPEVLAGNIVKQDANGQPVFDFRSNCEMSTYLLIPIRGVFLTMGVDAYFGGGTPDSWNIKVGATVPFTAFNSILGQ